MAMNIKTITSHLHSKNIIYGNSWDYLWQFMFVIIYYLTTDYADYSDYQTLTNENLCIADVIIWLFMVIHV